MQKKNCLLMLFIAASTLGPMAAQAEYDVQQIDHPGAPATQVFGINDRGDVVGNGVGGPSSLPFVYDSKTGTFTDIAPAAGYTNTAVLGISDSGVIVGVVDNLDGTRSGLIRHPDGSFTVFDHPEAESFTEARAINNKGLVTGFRDTAEFNTVGFIYDSKTDTFTDIAESVLTIAHGINSNGDVVGNATFFQGNVEDPCGSPDVFNRYAWLRTADGALKFFKVNGERTRARGISDSGLIAGDVLDPSDGKLKGWIMKHDVSNCDSVTIADSDLIDFGGDSINIPEGITNSGDIVGQIDDEYGNSHGFYATKK